MTFIPLLGAVIILCLPRGKHELIKSVAACAAGLPLFLSYFLWKGFDKSTPGMQFVEQVDWIPLFNIQYHMAVDGISVVMLLLTSVISFICIFASWEIHKGVKGYFALFLLLETGMMGVFCAMDFFLFYVFWEIMLLPMYFLIGIWGGPRKEYAAIKFFMYTLVGSVLMLVVMLVFYFNVTDPTTGKNTFNLLALKQQNDHSGLLSSMNVRYLCFIALFIGFAIKVPVFPFHTWLPDAHVEAPTAISVVLAGVLLKMGTYGLFRISFPLLPDQAIACSVMIGVLGAINIVYGALCALAQDDLKKMVAYSSVSHMGYCLLGMGAMTTAGFNGAMMQMFTHGTITAMLFLCVGVIYDRVHHRWISRFGGLATMVPVYTAFVTFAFFASLGLPGMSGFIAEALCFIGAWSNGTPVFQKITIFSTLGILLGAAFHLWALQRMFLGERNKIYTEQYHHVTEINGREIFCLVPLAILVLGVGIYPSAVLDLMNVSLAELQAFIQQYNTELKP
ncbi:MAG: NADH-quinone oxidoreductase subunit M [Candidatus Brocadiae bacterium]|nr:NADH-quinone oxidoreductase subunit M [Candidatus Brocadiia bacterium]